MDSSENDSLDLQPQKLECPTTESLFVVFDHIVQATLNRSGYKDSEWPEYAFPVPDHLKETFHSIKLVFDIDHADEDGREFYLYTELLLELVAEPELEDDSESEEYDEDNEDWEESERRVYLDQRCDLVLQIMGISEYLSNNTYLMISEEDRDNRIVSVPSIVDKIGDDEGFIVIVRQNSKFGDPNSGIFVILGDMDSEDYTNEEKSGYRDEEMSLILGGDKNAIRIFQACEKFILNDPESRGKAFQVMNDSVKLTFPIIETIGVWLKNLV